MPEAQRKSSTTEAPALRTTGTPAPRKRGRKSSHLKVVDRSDPNFDLDRVIDDMPIEYVQCRDYMHGWRSFTAKRIDNGLIEQTQRCGRCRSTRTRVLNGRGGVVESWKIDYVDGYLIKGLGRITGADADHVRLRSVEALLGGGK
jgi:hypothetical protein